MATSEAQVPPSQPIFDAHLHVIEPCFPLVSNNGYMPDPYRCDDYLKRTEHYNLCGGAIVSGSFQGYDQSYLIDALKKLGSSFVGVTQLPVDVTEKQLEHLNTCGVRALRFNLKRGKSEQVKYLNELARHVYEIVGWHIELYVDSRELPSLHNTLVALPAVSIDHLGLSRDGFSALLKLVEKGVQVKATGFGRVDFEVRTALHDIYSANPAALMFGTDLPSTRAPRPYQDSDIFLILETLGEEGANRVLYENAMNFYHHRKSLTHQ